MQRGDAMERLLRDAFPAPAGQPDWETQLLKALGSAPAQLTVRASVRLERLEALSYTAALRAA